MWHDDVSKTTSVIIFLLIVLITGTYLQFHPDAVRIRQLKKFNHFTEFDEVKQADAKFQILKQETMRIDNKLMTVD
jgi:hypothetical protein